MITVSKSSSAHLVHEVVADDPRARDEDVEAAELGDRLRDRGLHLVALRDVARDLQRRAFAVEVEVGDRDLRALLGEPRRRRRADASRAACYQGDLAVEPHPISTSASPLVTFSPACSPPICRSRRACRRPREPCPCT